MELELVLTKESLQSGYELAAEDAAERGNWEKEALGGSNPSGTIGGKTASGNNVVDVRMMLKILAPGMEHAEKTDVCSQMLRVSRKFEQRGCTRAEQQFVKQSFILQYERGEFVRQREDYVKVGDRQ